MEKTTVHSIGVIMNGVTGRMGIHKHLLRSIVEIRKQGGVRISDREVIMPEPMLVGRNPEKLEAIAAQTEIRKWTANLDEALSDPFNTVYFDAQTTNLRSPSVKRAIAAGKN